MAPDPIALNESESLVATPILSKPLHVRIARHISNLLSPMAVSLPFIFLVALYHATSLFSAIEYTCMTLFFLTVGPMLYILYGVRTGKFTDIDVSVRSQRAKPFLFGLTSALIGLLVLTLIGAPRDLQTVLLACILIGILYMAITLKWKISIHASSLAGALTMLTALYGTVVLPAFSLVVLLSWSRVVLRRHTLSQVVAGSLVSMVLASVVLALRGV